MTVVVACPLGAETTSRSLPDSSENAEATTIGVAEEPAVATGIQVPSAAWSTLPRGRDHSWAGAITESSYW